MNCGLATTRDRTHVKLSACSAQALMKCSVPMVSCFRACYDLLLFV